MRASARDDSRDIDIGGFVKKTPLAPPDPRSSYLAPPAIPPSCAPRLRIVNGEFVPASISHVAPITEPGATEQGPRALAYDRALEVRCERCSHDDCEHYHLPFERLSRQEAQQFLGYTENTLFTKHSRGEMPTAVAGPPLEFNSHSLAALKYDGVIMPGRGAYDREAHLAAIPGAIAERERRAREKSEKLSAHMRRRHAAARVQRGPRRQGGSKRRAAKAGAR